MLYFMLAKLHNWQELANNQPDHISTKTLNGDFGDYESFHLKLGTMIFIKNST